MKANSIPQSEQVRVLSATCRCSLAVAASARSSMRGARGGDRVRTCERFPCRGRSRDAATIRGSSATQGDLAQFILLDGSMRPPSDGRPRGASRAPARSVGPRPWTARTAGRPGGCDQLVESVHTPTASPANAAAPQAVVSVTRGRSTGTPRRCAWNRSSASFRAARRRHAGRPVVPRGRRPSPPRRRSPGTR